MVAEAWPGAAPPNSGLKQTQLSPATLARLVCYFVHIAVPREFGGHVRAWPSDDLLVSDCQSSGVTAHFRRSWSAFTVTDPSGHCSCDPYAARPKRFDEQRERARYRTKGGSEAKISRAVAARRPKETRYDRFVHRVAELVRICKEVQLCAIDGHEDVQVAFPRVSIDRSGYLAVEGTFPTETVVCIGDG